MNWNFPTVLGSENEFLPQLNISSSLTFSDNHETIYTQYKPTTISCFFHNRCPSSLNAPSFNNFFRQHVRCLLSLHGTFKKMSSSFFAIINITINKMYIYINMCVCVYRVYDTREIKRRLILPRIRSFFSYKFFPAIISVLRRYRQIPAAMWYITARRLKPQKISLFLTDCCNVLLELFIIMNMCWCKNTPLSCPHHYTGIRGT